MVYLNPAVHKEIPNYLKYLSDTLNVPDPNSLILGFEVSKGRYKEITSTSDIVQGIELVLGRKGQLNVG